MLAYRSEIFSISGLVRVLIHHKVGVLLQANVRDHTLHIEKWWLAFCHLLPTITFFMGPHHLIANIQ